MAVTFSRCLSGGVPGSASMAGGWLAVASDGKPGIARSYSCTRGEVPGTGLSSGEDMGGVWGCGTRSRGLMAPCWNIWPGENPGLSLQRDLVGECCPACTCLQAAGSALLPGWQWCLLKCVAEGASVAAVPWHASPLLRSVGRASPPSWQLCPALRSGFCLVPPFVMVTDGDRAADTTAGGQLDPSPVARPKHDPSRCLAVWRPVTPTRPGHARPSGEMQANPR